MFAYTKEMKDCVSCVSVAVFNAKRHGIAELEFSESNYSIVQRLFDTISCIIQIKEVCASLMNPALACNEPL